MKKKILYSTVALLCTVAIMASVIIPIHITTKAADTVIEPYVLDISDDLMTFKDGAANLIQNGGFESGTVGADPADKAAEDLGMPFFNNGGFYRWDGASSSNKLRTASYGGSSVPITNFYTITTEDYHSGSRSFKSAHSSSSDDWVSFDFYINITNNNASRLHDNTNYVLTFWAKTNLATPDWAKDGHFHLLYDPKTDLNTHKAEQLAGGGCGADWGWRVYANKDAATDGSNTKFKGVFPADGVGAWKQYKVAFNTGNNAKLIKIRINGLRGTIYYDDFELREMAPAVAKITNNNAIVQNVNNENHLTKYYDFEGLTDPTKFGGPLYHLNPNSPSQHKFLNWSISSEDKNSGDYSLKYTANAGDIRSPLYYGIEGLKQYTQYVVSFWANSSATDVLAFKFLRANEAQSVLKDYTDDEKNAQYRWQKTGWQKYTFLIDTGEDTAINLILLADSADVYYDDFCVFELKSGITPYIIDNLAGDVLYDEADNHISSGSFENLPSSSSWNNFLWNLRDASTSSLKNYFSITEEDAVSGTHSFKYDGKDGGSTGYWVMPDDKRQLTPNTEYVFTFRAKGRVDDYADFKFVYNNQRIKDYTQNSSDGDEAQYKLTSSDWKRYSYTFNSGDATTLSLVLISRRDEVQYYDDFAIIKKTDLKGGIVNNSPTVDRVNCDSEDNLIPIADFEQDIMQNSFWSYLLNRDIRDKDRNPIAKVKDYLHPDNTVSHTGNTSLRYHNPEKNKQYYMPIDIMVQPYSEYALSFWVKGEQLDEQKLGWKIHLDWDTKTRDYTDPNNPIGPQYYLETGTMGEWTQYKYIIQTGDKSNISFQIIDNGGTMWFDNFRLFETTYTKPMDAVVISTDDNKYLVDGQNNLLENGDLSNSDLSANWGSFDAATGITYGTDAVYGFGGVGGYLQYEGSNSTNGAYAIKLNVSRESNYTLSFRHNAITVGDGKLYVGIATDTAGSAVPNINMGSSTNGMRLVGKAVGWNHISVTFATNTSEDIWLVIKSNGNAGKIILDDFALYLAQNGAEKMVDESINIRPGRSWWSVSSTPAGYSLKDGVLSEENMIKNGDFETLPEGDWNVPTFLNGAAELTTEEAYSGKTGLKFSANGTRVSSVYWVKVKPQTMYAFQAMIKGYGLNKDNHGDLQFGIISAKNGKFLNCPDPEQSNYTIWNHWKAFTQEEQLNPTAWDGEWKNRGLYFTNETDEEQTVGIYITAENSTLYFDDIILTEAKNLVRTYKAPQADWQTALYGKDLEETICADGDNLVEGGKMNSDKPWQNDRNYGKFVSVNTELNRLCYIGTGHYANYFRWFDVKPDTVYTFSVYCKGEQSGNMSFGLCDDTSTGYKNIGGDDGVWKPTYDGVWHQYSIQFDTGNYSRIGFYICDGGGVADFAKMRLFESQKGMPFVESDIPPGGRVIEVAKDEQKPIDTEPEDESIEEADDEDDGGKKIVQGNKKVLKRRKIIVQNNWLVIGLIIAGSVLAVAAATAIIIILVKKKKRKNQHAQQL